MEAPIGFHLEIIRKDNLRLWARWLAVALRHDAQRWLTAQPTSAFPAQFLVATTYRCDSRCTHCTIWSNYLKSPQQQAAEMTLPEFELFLDKNPQLIQVVTTGGEPFNREDAEELWLALDRRGHRTSCATNAIATDAIMQRETALLPRLSGRRVRNFGVSIDGLEDVHDRVRGVKGNFAGSWRLFQWACEQEKRYPFYRAEISCTVTGANYVEFPAFVDWLVKQGVPPNKIGFMAALPSGHYYRNERVLKPLADRRGFADAVDGLRAKHPGFGGNYFTENYTQWLRDSATGVRCLAGTAFGYIDPYWNVYPCLAVDRKLGNLREHNFDVRALWRSAAATQFRREMAAEPCSRCFNECNRWISARATTGGLSKIALRQVKKAGSQRGRL